jgi:inhibitor of cysteine peptidase
VLGELKIPGFSTYLHPYDENHIIGIGMDTELVNNGRVEVARQKGMKLAIFDVTDLGNPIQEFMTTIGDQGTYSELLDNHKALLFSKEKNLLAFPISMTEQGVDRKNVFLGALVYNIDLNTGFSLKGKLTHMPTTDVSSSKFNGNSSISRVIYINDNIYSISNAAIEANDIIDLSKKGRIDLQ